MAPSFPCTKVSHSSPCPNKYHLSLCLLFIPCLEMSQRPVACPPDSSLCCVSHSVHKAVCMCSISWNPCVLLSTSQTLGAYIDSHFSLKSVSDTVGKMMILMKDIPQWSQFWILLILPDSEPWVSYFFAPTPVPSFCFLSFTFFLLFSQGALSLPREGSQPGLRRGLCSGFASPGAKSLAKAQVNLWTSAGIGAKGECLHASNSLFLPCLPSLAFSFCTTFASMCSFVFCSWLTTIFWSLGCVFNHQLWQVPWFFPPHSQIVSPPVVLSLSDGDRYLWEYGEYAVGTQCCLDTPSSWCCHGDWLLSALWVFVHTDVYIDVLLNYF